MNIASYGFDAFSFLSSSIKPVAKSVKTSAVFTIVAFVADLPSTFPVKSAIALGVFYKKELPGFDERFLAGKSKQAIDKDLKISELLKNSI